VSTPLLAAVAELLVVSEPVLGPEHGARIAELRRRIDAPLRVAIAGKVKAGKSTLLNALVGEKVAPTDARECTKVVTWYRNSHVYRVTAVPWDGAPGELRFRRTQDELEIELGGYAADDLQYVDVEWPTDRLRDTTLIDTPGLASIFDDISMRSQRYLVSDEQGPGEADAVIYLLRHLHPTDLSFLEAFRDSITTSGASVNSIAVISRADEIGSSRTNAMAEAEKVAARYRRDPRVHSLCQAVVPVAGLIAQAAGTLREDEALAIRDIAALGPDRTTDLLLSADRFVSIALPSGPDEVTRGKLLDRIGLFGVRVSVELIAAGRVQSTGELARELELRSGIVELRHILGGQFTARAGVLKARSTLATIWALAGLHGGRDGRMLRDRVRDIERSAHELVEIRLLSQLRSGAVRLGEGSFEARRVLGDDGPEPQLRLGLPPDATMDDVHGAAMTAIGRWRSVAEDPLLVNDAREVAQGVVRTCEALAVARG
jgi:tellurite resistance protein